MVSGRGESTSPDAAAGNPILVALDVPTAEEAVRLAKKVGAWVGGFKVGLELLLGPGPATVAAIAGLGKPVFADAKLADIPHTVFRASSQLGRLGARWVTAHASGGSRMLEAAVAGLAEGAGGRAAGILAVTVLTSLEAADLAATGVPATPGRQTARLAKLADGTGCEGVICAASELGVVAQVAPRLRKVVPGIRPRSIGTDDQRRTADPVEAMRRGADLLVIGRPITRDPDPARAARLIWEEIQARRSTW